MDTYLSFNEFSRIYVFLCRITGILPLEGRNIDFIGSRLLVIVHSFSVFIYLISNVVHALTVPISRMPLSVEAIYMFLLSANAVYMYCVVMQRKPSEFVRYDHIIRWICLVYYASSPVSVMGRFIVNYTTLLPPLDGSINGTERRILAYNWIAKEEYLGYSKYPGYHQTFASQASALLETAICSPWVSSMILIYVVLAVGFFGQLREGLQKLSDSSQLHLHDSDEIVRCVEFRQQLLHFSFDLESLFGDILLWQMLTACYCISLILIKLVSSEPEGWASLPLVFICVWLLFVTQWTADRLSDQSEGLTFEIYSAMMTRTEDKRRFRDLHIMLIRAQVPLVFMAGGFLELSLENYASMMNRAYSFFTVLRQLDAK